MTAVLAGMTWQAWHVQPKSPWEHGAGHLSCALHLELPRFQGLLEGFNAAEPNEGCAEMGSENSAGS